MINQTNEVNRLSKENEVVQSKLDDSQKTVRILQVELSEARELSETAKAQLEKKDREVAAIRREMEDLLQQLADKTKEFEIKDMESREMLRELKVQIKDLVDGLQQSENENAHLRELLQACQAEIESLRAKLLHDRKFRQFVEIKREVIDLRDKNELLARKVLADEKSREPQRPRQKTAHRGRRRAHTAGSTRLLCARGRLCNGLDSDDQQTAVQDVPNDESDVSQTDL